LFRRVPRISETRKRMSTEIAKWRAVIDRAGIERQ
jgi:hypothetical protein